MKKGILTLYLAIVVIFAVSPHIYANDAQTSGSCGENAKWSYTENTKTLTITGSGDMTDYSASVPAPWTTFKKDIKYIEVKGVTSIGDYAFCDCINVIAIYLHNDLTSIGDYAFNNNETLTQIYIPDYVEFIGDYAFAHCIRLFEVNIPNKLKAINCGLFYNCPKIYEIEIPESVTSIGDSAFGACVDLIEVDVPDSVISLGDEVFKNCEDLVSVSILGNVREIGSYTFLDCASLENIYIPGSVRNVGKRAFLYCSKLKDIFFGGSEADWENIAFDEMDIGVQRATKHYNIPPYSGTCGENVSWVLDKPSKTLTISGTGAMYDYDVYDYNEPEWKEYYEHINSVVVSDGVTHIGGDSFYELHRVTQFSIADSVTSIGYRAFVYCSDLTSITIPDSVESIGTAALSCCYYLKEATISDKITQIPNYLFRDCTRLKHVYLGDNVTSIGNDAFCRCSALSDFTIPSKVTTIGEQAFNQCISLTEIKIPDGVTSILRVAFGNCDKIAKVFIPVSVTNLEAAFVNCDDLKHVYYDGNEEEWNSITNLEKNESLLNAKIYYNCATETVITTLTAGDKGEVTFDAINVPDDAVVFVTSYDKFGRLLEWQSLILNDETVNTIFSNTDAIRYKAFIWAGDIMRPLTDAMECTLQ